MKLKRRICTMGMTVLLVSGVVHAHDGGHDEIPKAAAGAGGVSRIEAHSDLFEIVGVIEHSAMTLYLDRYADNEPVKNAKIEIEAGTEKSIATPNPDGTYTFASKLFARPEQASFTFTVIAGNDTDLLAGDLAVPSARANHSHDAESGPSRTTSIIGAIAAVVLAIVAGLALRVRRIRKKAF